MVSRKIEGYRRQYFRENAYHYETLVCLKRVKPEEAFLMTRTVFLYVLYGDLTLILFRLLTLQSTG